MQEIRLHLNDENSKTRDHSVSRAYDLSQTSTDFSMFECRACMLRCMRAIAGDSLPALRPQQQRLSRSSPRFSYPAARRTKTALAVNASDGPGPELQPGPQPIDTSIPSSSSARRAIKAELRYLADPLKLAEHVHYILRCDNPEKALELCRRASKEREVIVSWNHCIDWHMRQGRVNAALKIYNEMKKRGQFPDSHTYTLILRGLARKQAGSTNEEKASNVVKAVSLYNSLSGPNSKVKPSIIHTNAVLTVCSEAHDLDAIWGIKVKLPQSGPNAADERTYAIVLNALRHGAFADEEESGVYLETMGQQRQQALIQGRELWQEVIQKWSAGDLWVDEKLVVAMGRLLVWSKRLQDWDDVLSLVQQTMDVARQLEPLGSPGRKTQHIPVEAEGLRADPEVEGEREDYQGTLNAKAFNVVNPLLRPTDVDKPGRAQLATYVKPDNATLSLLIQACNQMHAAKAGLSYWDLLTRSASGGGYGVKPDIVNFHAMIRLLNMNRSSGKLVELLERSLPTAEATPTGYTFRIAMSVCQRDNKNRGVPHHSRRIVDSMMKNLPEPDIQTLEQFLSLTTAVAGSKDFLEALNQIDPIVDVLNQNFANGMDERTDRVRRSATEVAVDRAQIVKFFQQVIGAIDTAMSRGYVPQASMTHWHGRRRLLTSILAQQRKVAGRAETESGERSKGQTVNVRRHF